MLGDWRGWPLLVAQPVVIGAVLGLGALLLDSSRWIAVFPALVLLIGLWIGQAMHAHRLALARGAAPGGEMQLALVLPLVVILLSGFWLIGGGRASPAATMQHYVAAWQAQRPESAQHLFARPAGPDELRRDWQAQRQHIETLVREAAQRYGELSGLDPARPFNSLRFQEVAPPAGERSSVAVDVVRRQRVETSLFGLVPTATQETVLVEQLGVVRLVAQPAPLPEWLPIAAPGVVWLIEDVELAAEP
jgi:hypothetical protein